MSSLSKWIKLESPPNINPGLFNFSAPLFINNEELLLVLNNDDQYILKYNLLTDKWTKWCNFPKNIQSSFHTTAINKKKTKIYLFNEEGKIIEINIKTKIFKQSKETYHDGSHSASIFIDNKYHIFGGWFNDGKAHFLWDENDQKLKEIHRFNLFEMNFGSLNKHSIHYIESKQSILIIPSGHVHGICCNYFYIYSIITNNCFKYIKNIMKYSPDYACSVITCDNRYVLLFGDNEDLCEIYILDLKLKSMRLCNIKCPITGYWKAIIRNNKYKEILLMDGYLREITNEANISYPPIYLMKLIQSWYSDEYVHLFNLTFATDIHWMISVDSLLNA